MKMRILLILGLIAGQAMAGADEFNYSFEDASDLNAWKADPGVTLEVSDAFATEGKSSLKMIANAGVPWFGMRRDVRMPDFRNYEYLEFDIKTITKVTEFACELQAEKFQNLIIKWDQLEPGKALNVRVRLADNEIIRFGDLATISFWFANRTPDNQALYIDNLRLTGRGEEGRRLEKLRANVAQSEAGKALLGRIDAAFTGGAPISKEVVDGFEREWSEALLIQWKKTGLPFVLIEASSMAKFLKASSVAMLPSPLPAKEVSLDLARNEHENFQLIVVPATDGGLSDISVECSDLKNSTGQTIEAKNISLSIVGEVDIWGALQYPGDLIKGQVPDPLIPAHPFSVEKGSIQSLWVSVYAPASAESGIYAGKIIVKAAGAQQVVEVKAKVRNFVLPEKNTLKTIFTLWSHNWVNFYRYATYPKNEWFHHPSFEDIPMDKKMGLIDFCNRYRLGVSEMMTMPIFRKDEMPTPGLKEMLGELQKTNSAFIISMLEGNTVRKDGTMDEEAVKLIARKVRGVSAMVPPGTAYVYMLDEPHRQPEKGGWAAMQKEAEMIHRVSPGTKTYLASGVFLPPANDPSIDAIDAISMLWDRTPTKEAAKYQKKGKEIWWYGANVVSKPYPNWGLDYEAICPRVIPLMTFKFNIDGVLSWGCNLWADDNCDPNVATRWPDVPWRSTGWPYQPGEGHVFYPGKDGVMWPSIRLENWRDGMEDYEYLTLLKGKMPKLSADDQKRATELLNLNGVVNEPYDYTRDPKVIISWRHEVADLLEK